jgi:PAS domain S-box-containing protein
MEIYLDSYRFFVLNEIWLYSLTNQIYLITLLMVFSLVAYLFVKNRTVDTFSLTSTEQYHFLQAVTRYSDTADFIVDQNGVLRFANEHWLKLFGLDDREVDNMPIREISLPAALLDIIEGRSDSRESDKYQFRYNDHLYSVRIAPVTTHDGQHLGTLYKISDHIFTGHDHIEKGEWLHEINTPLNAIVGYSELLMKNRELSSDDKERLKTISNQSFLLKSRIQKLLSDSDASHINSSNKEHEPIQRVLVVDDVPINRTLLKIMLERKGYTVDEAENGQLAIEAFHQRKPDLVLMDISMPVMNGVEAVKKIRESGRSLKDLPIVAVTASSFYSTKESLEKRGFNALLQKPFKEKELSELIQSFDAA